MSPVGPVAPVLPVAPVSPAPVTPVAPVAPTSPASPVGPVAPVSPAPVTPVGPVAPVGAPAGPVAPVAPVVPEPVAPVAPVAPATPAVPAGPIGPLLLVPEGVDATPDDVRGSLPISLNRSTSDPSPPGKNMRIVVGRTPLMRIETSYAQPVGLRSGLSVVGRSTENEPVASSDTVVGDVSTVAESVSYTVVVGVNVTVPTPAIPRAVRYCPTTVRVMTSSDQIGTVAPFLCYILLIMCKMIVHRQANTS